MDGVKRCMTMGNNVALDMRADQKPYVVYVRLPALPVQESKRGRFPVSRVGANGIPNI